MGKGISKRAKKQIFNILFLLVLIGVTLFILFRSNRELNSVSYTHLNKIAIIKVVREATGLGLADAKKAVEAMGVIKENVPKADADALVAKLKENGATAELK